MSIDRRKDKEIMVYTYNGILLSHKNEQIWASWTEVDEPRAWYTEWSEKENQILYINTCIWNLEEWYWWTYLQGRDRDTNVESVVVDTVEEGKGGMNWELHWHTYTITCKINREGGSCVGEGIQLQALCSVMT